MRWHMQRFDFPTMPDEGQVPLDIVAVQTPEGVVFATKKYHGVVAIHLHQYHGSATRHTTHCRHSLTSNRLWRRPPRFRTITSTFKNV